MTPEEYSTAPSQEIFDDIKANAIKIWQTYDNRFGYVDEKLGMIEDVKNFRDNAAFIVAMFDGTNQRKLLGMVKPDASIWLARLLQP